MIPELNKALVDDGHQYYLIGGRLFIGLTEDDDNDTFSVVKYSHKTKQVIPCPHLASSRVVNRINAIIRELDPPVS